YQALGLAPPRFTHVPLVVGPDGRRLAKRHGDTRLSALRRAGVRAEVLLGLLGWSCGWVEAPRPVSAPGLVPLFDLETIPHPPFARSPSAQRVGPPRERKKGQRPKRRCPPHFQGTLPKWQPDT